MNAVRWALIAVLALTMLAVLPISRAEPPTTLVKEINPTTTSLPNVSNFNGFIKTLGDQAIFLANDAEHGTELWRTDGTTPGTLLLADLNPGSEGVTAPFLQQAVVAGARLFFMVLDSSNSMLWVTDGTTAGTHIVSETKLVNPTHLIAVGQRVFFITSDSGPALTTQLWVSDGTTTSPVKTWGLAAQPTLLAELGNTLLFAMIDTAGAELWRSDGTEAGTQRITDINPGAGNAFSTPLDGTSLQVVPIADRAYFFANNGSQNALWQTDGTSVGTTQVIAVNGQQLVRVGTMLFFQAPFTNAGQTNQWLWKSNGTAAGTIQFADLGVSSGGITDPTDIHSKLYFIFANTPYMSDGTTVTQLSASSVGDYPGPPQLRFVGVGDTVFFKGGGSSDAELWVSQGTPASTQKVRDINPNFGSNPLSLQMLGNQALFYANDGTTIDIWHSDGSEVGTTRLREQAVPDGIDAQYRTYERFNGFQIQDVAGKLFFAANRGNNDTEMFVSDGTDAGTKLIKDITPNGGSLPTNLVSFAGRAYFTAPGGLWVTDGSEAGTNLFGNNAQVAVVHGDALWYIARNGTAQLWRSDGISAGTLISNLPDQSVTNLVSIGDRLFFTMSASNNIYDLWISDGTAAGTVKVKALSNSLNNYKTLNFVALGNRAFFIESYPNLFSSGFSYSLWTSDGSEVGTVRLVQFGRMQNPPQPVVAGERVFLPGADLTNGVELWVSDGTFAGTRMLKDINTTAGESSNPRGLANLNGTLLFAANDFIHGFELWHSDGTEVGTTLLKDINPGPLGSGSDNLRVIGDTVYFSAGTGPNGTALWRSDGSAAGTDKVAEVANGPTAASPRAMTLVGSRLFFFANDAPTGLELHAISLLPEQFVVNLPLVVR